MRVLQVTLLVIFLGVILIFVVQNTEAVSVLFLNWRLTLPRSLLILLAYVLGMLSGWTVLSFLRRSIRRVSERPSE